MQLTAKSLAELIESLRSNPGEPGERRKEPRVGLRVRAEIALPPPAGVTEGKRVGVWVRDVSASGIGILCEHAFEAGDTFALLLGADGTGMMHCTVKNCRRIDERLHCSGAKFSDYTPKEPRRRRS